MTVHEATSPVPAPDSQEDHRQARRIYAASFVGTTIEFFDFILFGTAAALVFPAVFFEGTSATVGTIFSFATLAIGYAARPLGGIIGGHFGDKYGRKSVLITTLAVMGLSTFLIGLLPSSAQIGSLAPILLIALRVVQGVAVGGEWGGAVLMAVEHAGEGKRGFFGSSVAMGSGFGVLLAYSAFGMLGFLSEDQFVAFGWRIPFLFSIVLVAVGLYIRLKVQESPVFIEAKTTQEFTPSAASKLPIVSLFRGQPVRTLVGILVYAGPFMAQAILTTYVITYATTEFGLPRQVFLNAMMISLAGMVITVPLYGALSDRIGRRTIYVPAALAFGAFSFLTFPLVETGSTVTIILTFIIGMTVLNGATVGVVGSILAEIFPTQHRYTGASVSYQFAGLIGGGIGPLLAASLVGAGLGVISISTMIAAFCAISAISCYVLGDTRKRDLRA
jgi:MFS transporter, MHS family, shikimate and dehydroshikimate transport protein